MCRLHFNNKKNAFRIPLIFEVNNFSGNFWNMLPKLQYKNRDLTLDGNQMLIYFCHFVRNLSDESSLDRIQQNTSLFKLQKNVVFLSTIELKYNQSILKATVIRWFTDIDDVSLKKKSFLFNAWVYLKSANIESTYLFVYCKEPNKTRKRTFQIAI